MQTSIDRSALYAGGVELRASALRILPALFLLVWLCGWAAGELFVAAFLLAFALTHLGVELPEPFGVEFELPAGDSAWFVVPFLLVWFVFWTFGGVMAMRYLWQLAIGLERLRMEGGRLVVERFRGPFVQRRTWDTTRVERIERPDNGAVQLTVDGRGEPVSLLGSPTEQEALLRALEAITGRRRTS